MIEHVCGLPEGDKEELVSAGVLRARLGDLEPRLRQHLAHYAKGRWGNPPFAQALPDPDRLSRLTTPEERWEAAVVRFWWSRTALRCYLEVPDVARFSADVIQTPKRPPGRARAKLVSLGYRRDSPEYRAAMREESSRWEAVWTDDDVIRRDDPSPLSLLAPPPDEGDVRLGRHVQLSALHTEVASVPDVLASAARQCDLAIVANYMPLETCGITLEHQRTEEGTLGRLLSRIRQQRPGWSWQFHRDCLVAKDLEYRMIEASLLPDDVLAECEKILRPGSVTSIDALASLIARLNVAQIQRLYHAFPRIPGVDDVHALRLYGLLEGHQRAELAAGRSVPIRDLGTEARGVLLSTAQRSRPWVEADSLANTILGTIPRRLATGEDAFSFVIEYHFPDSPNDRDIVFTAPLSITVPPG
jgi:hypothetical protein